MSNKPINHSITIFLLTMMSLFLSPVASGADQDILLKTPQGTLLGSIGKTGTGTQVFKGIPYARPPIGVRRWQAPEAAPGWQGVRLAQDFSPQCMQPPSLDKNSVYYQDNRPMSEDCLYLNVWKPAGNVKKLPVMFWIHGGGFVAGTGAHDSFDGSALAEKGAVVVTINYRLNIFNSFAHPALSAESPHQASGNYGILDQIQALKWVQANIAAFGGDPDNVTIFGESAGGASVVIQLATPLSAGLFHKAIVQSGGGIYLAPLLDKALNNVPSVYESSTGFARKIAGGSIDTLRAMPAHDLLQAALKTRFPMQRTVIDGWAFPTQLYDIFQSGKQHDVPVILGMNEYDGRGLEGLEPPIPESPQAYKDIVTARAGPYAKSFLTLFPPEDYRTAMYQSFAYAFFGWSAETIARMTEPLSSKAYIYFYSHRASGTEKPFPRNGDRPLYAFHASEIPFVFNNMAGLEDFWPVFDKPNQDDIRLADIMSDYWLNFARTGVPAAPDQPAWRPFTGKTGDYMAFNKLPRPKKDFQSGKWPLFTAIAQAYRDAGWLLRGPELALGPQIPPAD